MLATLYNTFWEQNHERKKSSWEEGRKGRGKIQFPRNLPQISQKKVVVDAGKRRLGENKLLRPVIDKMDLRPLKVACK